MLGRWHVLLLILVTLAAFCGLAAAKLRATPKFDRVQVGMTMKQVKSILGTDDSFDPSWQFIDHGWECDEGLIYVRFSRASADAYEAYEAGEKKINRRGPLERLRWLAGWRPTRPPPLPPPPFAPAPFPPKG